MCSSDLDIAHSRVARSDVELFTMLGAKVRLCAPRTLLPAGVAAWPVDVFSDPAAACAGADAVICLRLQLERQQAGLLPDLSEYAGTYTAPASKIKFKTAKTVRL